MIGLAALPNPWDGLGTTEVAGCEEVCSSQHPSKLLGKRERSVTPQRDRAVPQEVGGFRFKLDERALWNDIMMMPDWLAAQIRLEEELVQMGFSTSLPMFLEKAA